MNKDPIGPTSSRSFSIVSVTVFSILVLYSIVSTGLWILILKHNDLSEILEAIVNNIIL